MKSNNYLVASSVVLVLSALGWNRVTPAQQAGTATAVNVDFQHQVRPILSDNCFHCHGPDEATRMVGLRLDTQQGAFEKRDSGAVIVPGNPNGSLLYQRITAKDAAQRMPPESSHKVLTDAQKELLKQWIEQGAAWKQHWSFVPVTRPPLPVVKGQSWVKNSIDAFILAKLEASGLQPSAETDKRTLIRRVSLDLTGLPPEPSEVEAFVKDDSKMLTRRSWTACWLPSAGENIGPVTGSMPRAMPTRMASTSTTIAKCGRIATGLSRPSIAI